ncbi:MAG: hypothetical protein CMP28_09165 [Roseibacillus sp.]|nr:hypothetical protein [Roseibacillus sp.]
MPVTLKCAACGAEVEFEELSPLAEETCPGCEVKVRQREGDEQMAIPVSMSLPEEFAHVDLNSVADKSDLLVGRYKKESEDPVAEGGTDLILAKALESLAHSIGNLEERLSRHEQSDVAGAGKEAADGEENFEESGGQASRENGHSQSNGVTVVPGNGNGTGVAEGGEIVQLEPEGEGKHRGKSKANPIDARVLVRREAAKVARDFRREKHTQADWDERAQPDERPAGFAWLMEFYPKTTILATMVMAMALILVTIFWMEDLFARKNPAPELTIPERHESSLGKLMADDPEAATAEVVARAFLNAQTAELALPFVWQSGAVEEKFRQYYRPLPASDPYELNLKQRVVGNDGKSQFVYRVQLPEEKVRLLILLPEGTMPKVFWEHFAEVGDLSWEAFLEEKREDPVEMRVWVQPVEKYVEGYNQQQWQSYMLHDYAETRKVLAYAARGLGADYRISEALRKPGNSGRDKSVMARISLTYMTEFSAEGDSGAVAEIKDVLATSVTSWLPKEFHTPASDSE